MALGFSQRYTAANDVYFVSAKVGIQFMLHDTLLSPMPCHTSPTPAHMRMVVPPAPPIAANILPSAARGVMTGDRDRSRNRWRSRAYPSDCTRAYSCQHI